MESFPVVRFIFLLLLAVFTSSCTSSPSDTPVTHEPQGTTVLEGNIFLPKPVDALLVRGDMYLDRTEILVMESYLVQIALHLVGDLPDPCHELRAIINIPDENKRIRIELYSVFDPTLICIQVLQPFDNRLGLGSYPSDRYMIYIRPLAKVS